MHPVTEKVRDQVESALRKKGQDPSSLSSNGQAYLQEKYDDIDRWMEHKPDWVKDEDIEPKVTKVGNSSSCLD